MPDTYPNNQDRVAKELFVQRLWAKDMLISMYGHHVTTFTLEQWDEMVEACMAAMTSTVKIDALLTYG